MNKLPNDYPSDIKEESEGAAHYKAEAKTDPKNKGKLHSMSKDEEKHKKMLMAIVKKHAK